jgi:hypothetical protein
MMLPSNQGGSICCGKDARTEFIQIVNTNSMRVVIGWNFLLTRPVL